MELALLCRCLLVPQLQLEDRIAQVAALGVARHFGSVVLGDGLVHIAKSE